MNKIIAFLHDTRRAGWIIALLALLVYANTVANKWAVDDGAVIHNNRLVQRGVTGIPGIFTHDFLYGSSGQNTDAVAGGRYRPLTPALYAVFSGMLGKAQRNAATGAIIRDAAGHPLNDLGARTTFPNLMHGLNVILFAVLCLVLYRFLLLLLRDRPHGLIIAFAAALLFTVHPIHTEAVANAKGSDEILSLLFSLLSARLFFESATGEEKHRLRRGITGALFFLLALLSKENAATFLFIIPLTILFFSKARPARALTAGAILILPLLVYTGLRVAATGGLSVQPTHRIDMMNDPFLVVDASARFQPLIRESDVMVLQHPSPESIRPMPAANRLATNLHTYARYLQLLVVPAPLTYDYYPRHIAVASFADQLVLLSIALHLGLLVLAVRGFRRRSLYSYGSLFYLITFSVTSNLAFPIGTNMAERFMFMPSVGMFMLFAAALSDAARRTGKATPAAVLGIAAVLYAGITFARNRNWKDNLTLFSHDLQISVNSAKVKSDYGEVVLSRVNERRLEARSEQRKLTAEETQDNIALLQSSLPHYKQALDVYPMYGLVWLNLARTNAELGSEESIDPKLRLQYLNTAVAAYRLTDTYKPVQYVDQIPVLRSQCYAALGKLYGERLGDVNKALEYLTLAEQTDTANAYAAFLLGTAYGMKGDPGRAYAYTERAYRMDSANRDYAENYALILQKMVRGNFMNAEALLTAERLLLHVAQNNKALPDDDPAKRALSRRTLGLLYDNYQLRGRGEAAEKVARDLQQFQ